ncbi:peroxidase 40 [Silene latifolia]|uniref:peroxidase 40 n=1 Tax=Silene latifolia TaxID=37657 RepID=UPI003D778C89
MCSKIGIYVLVLGLLTVLAQATRPPKVFNTTCENDSETGALQIGGYRDSCPDAEFIIFSWVQNFVLYDPRMAASLLRLHFHDCFVNGCDASVLLDDTDDFIGEKTAAPNLNSLRGFEVIDAIKTELEVVCPGIVSCADILAVAARDSIVLSNGPGWEVETGRRDGLTASKAAANANIPAPNSTVQTLLTMFRNVGLTLPDMVALSGAHTLGKARCSTFSPRLQTNKGDINLDFMQSLQQICSITNDDNNNNNNNNIVVDLDLVTPSTFDNQYYVNLLSKEGLLPSDQVLVDGENDQTAELARSYADDEGAFFDDFQSAMLKMGSIGVLTGSNNGEIRVNCRAIN